MGALQYAGHLHGGAGYPGSKGKPVSVEAHLFAGPGTEPDLSGALETVGDILQESAVIANDRWIKSWDGSRVHTTDKTHPRTELTIRPMEWES